MSQNNIIKIAYDQGVQQAPADFGLRKLSEWDADLGGDLSTEMFSPYRDDLQGTVKSLEDTILPFKAKGPWGWQIPENASSTAGSVLNDLTNRGVGPQILRDPY